MRPPNLFPCVLLLLLATVASGQSLIAAHALIPTRDTERVSVVLTISGGASLGSYEAGLNWGLLEVFKLTARDSLRRAWNLPRYDLKVMAGASAGNVNGFVAAIDWCRTSAATAPERSLLWKVWVRPGFDQLFPLPRYNEADTTHGLLSRRYFDQVLFDTLSAAMADLPSSESPETCTIPVGVTITRVAPDSIAISRSLHALTQRYVAVVLVSRRGRTLEYLAPPPDLASEGKLGTLLLLPDCDGIIDRRTVSSLIEASSAFPGIFPPILLKGERSLGSGCGGASQNSALFADGGVFDNDPIDLAAGIYDETVGKNPSQPDAHALMVFVDPDRVRGRLAHVETQRAQPPLATGGITALLNLFAGAVPAARQYELQSFARLLAWAPGVFDRDNIRSTDRGFLVVGEQLGAFAAFLGKPFREYDFYVGIYDALSFFAREACQAVPVDSVCIRQRLHELVETTSLNLGDVATPHAVDAVPLARTVLRLLYQREWHEPAAAVPSVNRAQAPRDVLVLGLVQAHFALEDEGFDNARCRTGDVIVKLLCRDGFRAMLTRFGNDTVREALRRAVGGRTVCMPDHWLESPIQCDADESFEAFVENPERFMADKFALMLHQLWLVEQTRKSAGQEDWAGLATLSEVVFQSGIAYQYRRGVDLNTSSVPQGSGGAWLTTLVPNYVSINALSRGFELGYRPTVHLSNSLALALNAVPFQLIGNPVSGVDRYRWAVGPALHWKRTSTVRSGVEGGVEVSERWQGAPPGTEAGWLWSIPVTWYVLADKLRIGLRVFPDRDTAVQGQPRVDFSIGLADVNGLVYWLLRR